MMTWAVHMRDPGLLLRQLGPWKFVGLSGAVSLHLVAIPAGTCAVVILAACLWASRIRWPDALPPMVQSLGLMALFLFTEVINIALNIVALRQTPNIGSTCYGC